MQSTIKKLEHNIDTKSKLLIEGCDIDVTEFPDNIHKKKIHLYEHSRFKKDNIPDDIILGEGDSGCIARIRYNPNSDYKIIKSEGNYILKNKKLNFETNISFVPRWPIEDSKLDATTNISKICSLLGTDLLGIVPSNHCFYFAKKEECKFCEIWDSYTNNPDKHRKYLKKPDTITAAINKVMHHQSIIKHLVFTSGNIKNYDFTVKYFCTLGNQLVENNLIDKFDDILGTLMPPDDFSLLEELKLAGFNKLYFPLEVFNKRLFEIICPGKANYGYEKIMDALKASVKIFGKGNVYTNFVYGIQSLNYDLNTKNIFSDEENKVSLEAAAVLLENDIIPVFTVYHNSGHNQIGNINLNSERLADFFKSLGKKILNAKLIKSVNNSVIFSPLSLSNTIYNEGFLLSKLKEKSNG